MKSSFHLPLPACSSESTVTLTGQPVNIRSEARLQQLPAEGTKYSDVPLIENYYCQNRGGVLVKITVVRIGHEVLRLTDYITLRPQTFTEDDNKTKYSSNSQQQEEEPKQKKPRKSHLSKDAKKLFTDFQKWIQDNEPESLKLILAVKKESTSQAQLLHFLTFNFVVRDLFLAFTEQFFSKKQQIKVEKLAMAWTKKCLMARQEYRMKEQYIQDVLIKM